MVQGYSGSSETRIVNSKNLWERSAKPNEWGEVVTVYDPNVTFDELGSKSMTMRKIAAKVE